MCARALYGHFHSARTATLAGLLLAASLMLIAMPARANDEGLLSLRSAAMGDNVVGGAGGNAALFHNPAGLAAAHLYSLELGYNNQLKSGRNHLGISIADAKTNPNIFGGMAYTFSFHRAKENADSTKKTLVSSEHNLRVAAAVPLIEGGLVLGVTAHYMFRNDNLYGESNHVFTIDAGVLGQLGEQFFIGVVAQNLLQKSGLTDPRKIRAGLAGVFGPFQILAEYGVSIDGDHTRHHVGAGMELMVARVMAIRAGYRYLTQSKDPQYLDSDNVLSVGLGYRGRKFGMDLTYRQQIGRHPVRLLGLSIIISP